MTSISDGGTYQTWFDNSQRSGIVWYLKVENQMWLYVHDKAATLLSRGLYSNNDIKQPVPQERHGFVCD
ncbi:MAG: hypothetical protein CMJ19_24455 [Phycisphaeraceae bacterium]|nr:hypothetical protein [Phycisphaeraceae bacterium]